MLRFSSPRRRLLALATALLVAAGVAAAAVAALGGRHGAAGRVVPVLLVPGYGGTTQSLAPLAARLRAEGRAVTVVDLPDQGTGDLDASAAVLGRAVAATGAARVDLVGYSAGGLVVRAFLVGAGGAGRSRHVVLLGSPNHGAALAGLAVAVDPGLCTGACAELTPGSSFLARLNRDETPPGPDYTSIWTDRDETVTPPASAVLEGATNVRLQDVCAGSPAGHGDLVRDPLALGLVVGALAGDLPRRPGPGDCAALRAAGAGPRDRSAPSR